MTDKVFDFRDLVHSPAELATEYVQWAEHIHKTPGVPFGVPAIDKVMIPMHPGDLGAIVARPGHGKTSILAYLARAEAKRIIARGTQDRECVIYVTWEQHAEEIENIFELNDSFSPSDVAWGRADMDAVRRNAVGRVSLPVWVIGHSLARSDIRMPRMTLDVVFGGIERMRNDYGIQPTLICMDYVQIIPVDRVSDRVTQVTEATIRSKELMMRVNAAGWIGVQARREVDDRVHEIKLPKPRDAQWGSIIEQTVDKFFSQTRPFLTEDTDETPTIKINGKQVPITENLLVTSMQKQRFEKAGFIWPMYFAPQYLKLCELEMKRADGEGLGYDY
jgi:replicative DNA helicase